MFVGEQETVEFRRGSLIRRRAGAAASATCQKRSLSAIEALTGAPPEATASRRRPQKLSPNAQQQLPHALPRAGNAFGNSLNAEIIHVAEVQELLIFRAEFVHTAARLARYESIASLWRWDSVAAGHRARLR